MRTLSAIIDDVQDGIKPDYEELRYTVVALLALRHFDANAIRKLYQRERDGKYKPALFGLEWEAKESHERYRRALAVSPKDYVGPEHDPDTEECQRFRRMAKGVLKHLTQRKPTP